MYTIRYIQFTAHRTQELAYYTFNTSGARTICVSQVSCVTLHKRCHGLTFYDLDCFIPITTKLTHNPTSKSYLNYGTYLTQPIKLQCLFCLIGQKHYWKYFALYVHEGLEWFIYKDWMKTPQKSFPSTLVTNFCYEVFMESSIYFFVL